MLFINNWLEFKDLGAEYMEKNSKDIVTNSSRNRKIDLPAIRHSFSKIIRAVPNSDEENKFSKKQKKT